MMHAQLRRLGARLGWGGARPVVVNGWGAVPALVPVLAGAGTARTPPPPRGPESRPHRIFGRHKEIGPADPEGGPEAEDASPEAAPPERVEEPADGEASGAGLDLPEWAAQSLDAGSPTPIPGTSDAAWDEPPAILPEPGSQDAPDLPRETELGWRERRAARSWSRAGSAPLAVPGAPDAEAEPLAATGWEAVVQPAADDGADEPYEVPPATFGVPEDPTLLLRPGSGDPPDPDPTPPAETPGTSEVPAATPEDRAVIDLTPMAPRAEPRAFPLPEGEVVFRNLRTAFTDPSRLLRHLASDGHTGVLEIISGSERSSYVVLLDGGVVAVALETGGVVRTTNRVGFPAFPDGQDTLNVFRYPAEVARGLGLLLHAPVHFSGLGAVFVDLDGLRTYLETRRADGGLVVTDGEEIGVALFAVGKLVGAYTASERALGDLDRIRALVAKPDAEIDVRMGGPSEPPNIPLDELLQGLGT